MIIFLVLGLSISAGVDPTAVECAEVLRLLTQGTARVTHVTPVSLPRPIAPETEIEPGLALPRAELAYTIQGPGNEVAIVHCGVGPIR